MDVHCSSCGEPWDVHHLRHEAIFETALSPEEARAWANLPSAERLSPRYRQEFIGAGWYFGRSVINVVHCPACPDGVRPNPERVQTKAALEELLGDDEDGLASTYADYRL